MKSQQFEDAENIFNWNEVPGSHNDVLKRFLKLKFSLNWMDGNDDDYAYSGVKIEKIDSGNTIKITSADGQCSILINLSSDKTKATIQIDDRTYTYDVKEEDENKLSVFDYAVYQDVSEYLADELQLLDLRLNREIKRASRKISNPEENQGIIIEKQKQEQEEEDEENWNNEPNEKILNEYISKSEKKLLVKRRLSIEKGMRVPPLVLLSTLLKLDRFEELNILICLAPELDTKYERLYAYLQNNIANKFPTIDLIIRLLDDPLSGSMIQLPTISNYFSSEKPMQKYHLIHFIDNNFQATRQNDTQFHLVSAPLKLDYRVVEFLIEGYGLDKRLEYISDLVEPDSDLEDLSFKGEAVKKLCDIALSYCYRSTIADHQQQQEQEQQEQQQQLVCFLIGEDESEKKIMAESVCRLLDKKLLIVNLRVMFVRGLDFEWLMESAMREALFQQALVYLEGFDKVIEDVKNESFLKTMSGVITKYNIMICFLSSGINVLPIHLSNRHTLISIDFPSVDNRSSSLLWQSISRKYLLDDNIDFDLISSKFYLSRSKIDEAFKLAGNMAILRNGKNNRITFEDLNKACRSLSSQKLGSMTKKVDPKYTWSDIILPSETVEQLEQICNHVKYKNIVYGKWGLERKLARGKGLNILFSGHSGTGKTMAAEIIANELQLDLYKIDLSMVISKYIGETEKNLGQVFNEAEERNSILFFDEADALFGKRSEVKDAHDRYANTEINYLLQKMEDYNGVSILATNLKKNIDEAFLRRLSFLVDFPVPDDSLRFQIWKKMLAGNVPLEEDIDFEYLSKQFSITGGNIRNIVVNSAFLAAASSASSSATSNSKRVSMKYLVLAMKRELEKAGRSPSKSDFGKYQHLLEQKLHK